MNDLFDQKGHLTDDAFKYLISGELNELNRLEVSEHLSFCDNCILRYTEYLTDDCLIAPEQPLSETIIQRIKKRARMIFFNKYVTMGIAASFAIVFWISGVFDVNLTANESHILNKISNTTSGISETTVKITQDISDGIQNIFKNITLGGVNNNEKK